VALGVALALVVGFLAWFALQLLSQNGRIIARLEAIEGAIGGAPLAGGGPLPALGSGLDGGGLPVGALAPTFALSSTDGEHRALGTLLAAGVPLLLVFSDAGCGPCDALLPEVADWQREHHQHLQIALVASGDQQRNREKADRHGLELVLLQTEREVSDAYQAHGTPMAVVIAGDGLIASPTVSGADAIRTLVAQAIAPPLRSCTCLPPTGAATATRRRTPPSAWASGRPSWCWPTSMVAGSR
jgi:peroxiredoxin